MHPVRSAECRQGDPTADNAVLENLPPFPVNEMHVAQEIRECFPMEGGTDQDARKDKVSDALRRKLLEKQQARYE